MSSAAKRMKKLRKDQTEEEVKAQREKDAQRMRDKRAAAKNAKIKDPQQRDQKSPHESSSLSHGPDDSGFDTISIFKTFRTSFASNDFVLTSQSQAICFMCQNASKIFLL